MIEIQDEIINKLQSLIGVSSKIGFTNSGILIDLSEPVERIILNILFVEDEEFEYIPYQTFSMNIFEGISFPDIGGVIDLGEMTIERIDVFSKSFFVSDSELIFYSESVLLLNFVNKERVLVELSGDQILHELISIYNNNGINDRISELIEEGNSRTRII
ncbi:hypothetical protein GCM10023314_30500 [Algibacter agarivorans]|uniref:Uncharacterized protein n=1 Tax=Algibacter agarivorans TaxID=1109741 RepID=A0ABP9H2N6_9FLAO